MVARLPLLALCFGFLLHALLLPIQYDEAATILHFAQAGPPAAFTEYPNGTNNYPLLSLLLGLLLQAGVWDLFVLRLPSLLAACAALLAVDRLSSSLPNTLRLLFPFCLVAMPLFLDYLVMARGYAPGLALILWGIIAFRTSRPLLAGFLFALSTACVPAYALDVVMLWAAFLLSGARRKDVFLDAAVTCGLSLLLYCLVLADVITTSLSLVGEGAVASLKGFLAALHGRGLVAGGAILLAAAIAGLWPLRNPPRGMRPLFVASLLSLATLPVGYPRTHLLPAFLLALVLFHSLPERW